MTPEKRPHGDTFGNRPRPITGRLKVYPRLLLTANIFLTIAGTTLYALGIWEPKIFADFVAFYSAAELAAEGELAAAFDGDRLLPIQNSLLSNVDGLMAYFYPPSYMLAVFWLPGLPYFMSGAVFTALTFAVFFLAVRPLLTDRDDLVIFLAAPVIWLNAWNGQNAFMTTALALFAFHAMRKSEVRAGLFLSLLTIKPHLGLLWPVYLMLRGLWLAIAAAAAGTLALVAISGAIFGFAAWQAFFLLGLSNVHSNLSLGELPITLVSSPYGGLIVMGFPVQVSMALHIGLSLIAVAILAHLVWLRTPYQFVMAYLFAATLFVTPHNFTYDWMFVLVALLIVWKQARLTGFLPFELGGLILGYLAPPVLQSLRHAEVPLAPFTLLLVMLVVGRRAYCEARAVNAGNLPRKVPNP